jgi:hypothetical protein
VLLSDGAFLAGSAVAVVLVSLLSNGGRAEWSSPVLLIVLGSAVWGLIIAIVAAYARLRSISDTAQVDRMIVQIQANVDASLNRALDTAERTVHPGRAIDLRE